MSGRGRGLRPRKVRLPSSSTAEESNSPSPNIADSAAAGCIQCRCKELVSKLQKFKKIDDACSLMGMVTAFSPQLREDTAFFMQMMRDVYRAMENGQEHQLRFVLLHLIELVASNGNLPESTLRYYNEKVVLPKSCEDAFNASMKFGEDNVCSLQTSCSSCQKTAAAVESRSPEVMTESAIVESTISADDSSNHSGVSIEQKEPNNNNVDDENLAEVFGRCMESALSNCLAGSQTVSQPLEELVKAEKEEGPQDAAQSQVLPSTTVFELLSSFRGSECAPTLRTGNKGLKEAHALEEEEDKRLKEEEKTKKFERFMKVRGDVVVHLSSDLKDHLKDVFDVLTLHFKSPLVLPENAATVPNHFSQKVKAYSRQFLLECSSSAYSRQLPCNWSEISDNYPEICLMEGKIFTVDSYTAAPHWIVLKTSGSNFRRSNSSPYPGGDHANGTKHPELQAFADDI